MYGFTPSYDENKTNEKISWKAPLFAWLFRFSVNQLFEIFGLISSKID